MNFIYDVLNDFKKSFEREKNARRIRATNALAFLTYRCTSSCKTCNIWRWGPTGPELDWAEWKKILSQLKDYGIETIEIFGGDALLRKDVLFNFIEYCSDNGIETFIPTNSILLDRETARGLAEAGLGTIYFSLDDIGSAHDRIRGKSGAFERVRQAIAEIASARKNGRPRIIICSTISSLNFKNFPRVVEFSRDYPIDAVYARPVEEYSKWSIDASLIDGIAPRPYFTVSDGNSHLLGATDVAHFREILETAKSGSTVYINARAFDAPGNAFGRPEKSPKCLVCRTLMVLDPGGGIMPCPMYTSYMIGRLPEDNPKEVWGNGLHRNFIRHQRAGAIKICLHCTLNRYYPSLSGTAHFYSKKIAGLF